MLSGVTVYTHDADGNLIRSVEPAGPTTRVFDGRNKLVMSISTAGVVDHFYDGDGRRRARRENGFETRYVLDTSGQFDRILEETDSTGEVESHFVYGLGLVQRIDSLGERSFYHTDRVGSNVALTDVDGMVSDAYAYGPFGELLGSSGSTPNPFKFGGATGLMDEGGGIYFARARFYDSSTGRFVGRDPEAGNTERSQTLNPYVYALNRPLALSDPSGRSPREIGDTTSNSGTSDVVPRHQVTLEASRLPWWFAVTADSEHLASRTAEVVAKEALDASLAYLGHAGASGYRLFGLVDPGYVQGVVRAPVQPTLPLEGLANPGVIAKGARIGAQALKVGFFAWDAYEISKRDDLSGSQQLAVLSLKLIPGTELLGDNPEALGVWLASDENPVVQAGAGIARRLVGDEWLLNQSWLDAF